MTILVDKPELGIYIYIYTPFRVFFNLLFPLNIFLTINGLICFVRDRGGGGEEA